MLDKRVRKKDLVVDESWRRRGLGKALLWRVFHTFATRGASAVDLKVEATNTGALALYDVSACASSSAATSTDTVNSDHWR